MFQYTSNSFLFAAAAAVALIVWLDSRTGTPGRRPWAMAGRSDGTGHPGPATTQQRQAPEPAASQPYGTAASLNAGNVNADAP